MARVKCCVCQTSRCRKVQDPAAKASTPRGAGAERSILSGPAAPPAEPRSLHRGCNTNSAAVRGGLKVLHPGRLPVITPVGNHMDSRSSLNIYKVSDYDELFTSLCTAQLLLQGKAQWQRLCQARKYSHCRYHWKSPQHGPANVP